MNQQLKNLPTEKTAGLDGFTRKLYQAFKRERINITETLPENRKRDYLNKQTEKPDGNIVRKENS